MTIKCKSINFANDSAHDCQSCYIQESATEKLTLKKALSKLDKTKENKVAVLIWPEGGFDDIEIEQAKQNSLVNIVTLGKRILRTETAPLVISSNILYELED